MIKDVKQKEKTRTNPYVGPRSFEKKDKDWYFGRNNEADELCSLLTARRLVLFYAQSGAGKTSLIRARLWPLLEEAQDGFELLPIGRVGDSLRIEAHVKNTFSLNLMMSLGVYTKIPPERLAALELSDFLLDLEWNNGRWTCLIEAADEEIENAGETEEDLLLEDEQTIKPRALIIDQFEEIFTVHPELEKERVEFFQQLSRAMAADPFLFVMLSMREDYIAQLSPYVKYLPDGLRTRYYMQRMQNEAALAAVSAPAAKAGRPFSADVPKELVSYLRRVRIMAPETAEVENHLGLYIEPVQLQVVCYQLWQSVKTLPGDQITMADVTRVAEQLAGSEEAAADPLASFIDTALAGYYEQALKKVLADSDVTVSEYDLRSWFSKVLITSAGIRNLVARGETETQGMPEVVIRLLDEKHHLVRNDIRGGRPFVELIHDSFVNPILQANQQWRENQALKIPWLSAAFQYQETKDTALLLSGDALIQAQQQAQMVIGLPDEVKAFLKASEDAQRDQELAQAAEREKLRLRQLRIYGAFLIVAVIAMFIAIGGAIYGLNESAKAERAAWQSNIDSLVARASKADAEAKGTVAANEAEKAQAAGDAALAAATVAAVQAKNAREAEAEAQRAEDVARALLLAGQSVEYLDGNNPSGSLLLAVEAEHVLTEDITDTDSIALTEDLVQGVLLSSLYDASNRFGQSAGDESDLFWQPLPAPGGDLNLLLPGSVLTAPLKLQGERSEVLSQAFANFPDTQLIVISPDGRRLAQANNNAEINVFDVDLTENDANLTEVGEGYSLAPAEAGQAGADVYIEAMAFNQSRNLLAVAYCEINQYCSLKILEISDEALQPREEYDCANILSINEAVPTPAPTSLLKTATTTPTPTASSRVPASPAPPVPVLPAAQDLITGLAFLRSDASVVELVWSTNLGLNLQRVESGLCARLDRVPLPENHQVKAMAYLPDGAAEGLLLTVGAYPSNEGSMQWWHIRYGEVDMRLSPLGSLLESETVLTAVHPLLEETAFVTVDSDNRIDWYDADMDEWPHIACRLAGRSQNVGEWQTVHRDTDFEKHGFSRNDIICSDVYDLHISFAEEMLSTCNDPNIMIDKAHVLFALAYPGKTSSDFKAWAVSYLMQWYASDRANFAADDCWQVVEKIVGSAGDSEKLKELRERVINFSPDSTNESAQRLQALYAEILELPDVLQPVFDSFILEDYATLCYDFADTTACEQVVSILDESVTIGDSIFSSTDKQQLWRFEGEKGDIISINLNAISTLDPNLRVFNIAGGLPRTANKSGNSARIPYFIVSQPGPYFIWVSGYGDSDGEYELSLDYADVPLIGTEPIISTTEEQASWQFSGETGQQVTIDLESTDGQFDPYLTLHGPNSFLIADDDGGEGINGYDARLEFIISESGRYVIETGRPYSAIPYTLTVQLELPEPVTIPHQVTLAESNAWSFSGTENQLIHFSLEDIDTSQPHPHLSLVTPEQEILWGNIHEALPRLASSGTYTIVVTGVTTETENLVLRLEDVTAQAQLARNNEITGTLSGRNLTYWATTNDLGGALAITITQGAANMGLALFDPAGEMVYSFNGRDPDQDPKLFIRVPITGSYILAMGGLDDQVNLPYSMIIDTVGRAAPQACGLTESLEADAYFPLEVGSRVILGEHTLVDGSKYWSDDMHEFVDQEAQVTALAGVDPVGCPVVYVDLDEGHFYWRIRNLVLLD